MNLVHFMHQNDLTAFQSNSGLVHQTKNTSKLLTKRTDNQICNRFQRINKALDCGTLAVLFDPLAKLAADSPNTKHQELELNKLS